MHTVEGLTDEINHYFMDGLNELNMLVVDNFDCYSMEQLVVAYGHSKVLA